MPSAVALALTGIGILIGGGVLGAAATVLTSTRELRMKRVIESTDLFLRVAAQAHGYPPDDRTGSVGRGEQLAAIRLIGTLGNEYKALRPACRALLEQYDTWTAMDTVTLNLLVKAGKDTLANLKA